ncbi:MAG TPA: hypothetical protein VMC41_03480 [Candidatus Nanoarchaeia archaeon]|nr:hypothetical protein [Candidatus Nanoarchaeia archaeon]
MMDDPGQPYDNAGNDKGKTDSAKMMGFVFFAGMMMVAGAALYHLAHWVVNYFHLWKW